MELVFTRRQTNKETFRPLIISATVAWELSLFMIWISSRKENPLFTREISNSRFFHRTILRRKKTGGCYGQKKKEQQDKTKKRLIFSFTLIWNVVYDRFVVFFWYALRKTRSGYNDKKKWHNKTNAKKKFIFSLTVVYVISVVFFCSPSQLTKKKSCCQVLLPRAI